VLRSLYSLSARQINVQATHWQLALIATGAAPEAVAAGAFRAVVAPLGRDRVLSTDIAAAAELVSLGGLDVAMPAGFH